MLDTCCYTFIQTRECAAARVTAMVTYGLWVIEMCQCACSSVVRSLTALVGDAGYREAVCQVGRGREYKETGPAFCSTLLRI